MGTPLIQYSCTFKVRLEVGTDKRNVDVRVEQCIVIEYHNISTIAIETQLRGNKVNFARYQLNFSRGFEQCGGRGALDACTYVS